MPDAAAGSVKKLARRRPRAGAFGRVATGRWPAHLPRARPPMDASHPPRFLTAAGIVTGALLMATAGGAARVDGLAGAQPPAAGRPPAPPAPAWTATLARALDRLARQARPGVFAVGVADLATGQTVGVALDRPVPMQSVFKALLGALVLAEVDAGRLALDSAVVLTRADLAPPYSPVADAWPGRARYTVAELLESAVGTSDNTAADVLMRLVGGPAAVTRFLRAHGIAGVRVDRYEREFQPQSVGLGPFQEAWIGEAAFTRALAAVPLARRRAALRAYLADLRDTATPRGALAFLRALHAGRLLSPASTARLLDVMTRTGTGARRLKAGLPAGAALAHKTGAGRTEQGVNAATNDIGLVTLPDGRRFAVAAFLAGSTAPDSAREALFAAAARLAAAAVPGP